MIIYDAHMHTDGSIAPNPDMLLERLAGCGITGGNVLSIDPDDDRFTYEERMDNLFGWVKGHEDRLFPVAWLHPFEDNILDKVKDAAARGVVAYKFIANNYYVGDPKPAEVFHLIEELGLPILFHSGILYDFCDSSRYNKPSEWECFVNYKDLRFSMGHCGNPWYDECFSVYGKFCWIENHLRAAAKGQPFDAPELWLDTTPGAHGLTRVDMLTKLIDRTPNAYRVFFGSDKYVESYPSKVVKGWLDAEKEVFDRCGVPEEVREDIYCNNMFRFLRIERKV